MGRNAADAAASEGKNKELSKQVLTGLKFLQCHVRLDKMLEELELVAKLFKDKDQYEIID